MQELHPEKKIYKESTVKELNDIPQWLKWSKEKKEEFEILSESNLKEFNELYGKKMITMKEDGAQYSVWRHSLPSGNLWIFAGNKKIGTLYRTEINVDWNDLELFLDDLYGKLSIYNEARLESEKAFQMLTEQHGKALFEICNKKHCYAIREVPEKEDSRLFVSVSEVLDEVPDWWQSFSEPLVNAREIAISLIKPSLLKSESINDYVDVMVYEDSTLSIDIILKEKGLLSYIDQVKMKGDVNLIETYKGVALLCEQMAATLEDEKIQFFEG